MKHVTLEDIIGKGRVKKNVILAPYTTFKMGGRAEFFFEAETKEDLINAFRITKKLNLPFLILGGGSNIALVGEELKGLVVRNLYIEKQIVNRDDRTVTVKVSSGYPMNKLVKETIKEGFSGLEHHLGLPGSIGGAIYMNSKWYVENDTIRTTSYVGDRVVAAEIVNQEGKVKEVKKDYFQFGYDSSILQKTKELLLTVTFLLKKEKKEILEKRAEKALAYRQATQPFGVSTSGCFFKNVNGRSSGYFIDQCGLKGYSVGDFYVSEKHANFIVNRGKGKRKDLLKLLKYIKDKVKEKFGVKLKEEVVIVKNF